MPALLGFAWLYSVTRKEDGILKSCFSQILWTKGALFGVMHTSFWRSLIHQLASLLFKSLLWLALCFSVRGGASLLEEQAHCLFTRLWLQRAEAGPGGPKWARTVSPREGGSLCCCVCLAHGYMDAIIISKISLDWSGMQSTRLVLTQKSETGNVSHPPVSPLPACNWDFLKSYQHWLVWVLAECGRSLEHINQFWNLFSIGGLIPTPPTPPSTTVTLSPFRCY